MSRLLTLYRSSVGKKVVMAVTGLVLLLFVIGHMLGNLKVYQGPIAYNAYAEHLRELGEPVFGHGQLLWIARIGLIAAAVFHIVAAVQLTAMSYAARQVPYRVKERLAFSYASYTMRWGGLVILAFVIYHLMHLTWGNVHHDFVPGSVYHNVVSGFQRWPVSLAYILAMIPLGFHLYHGLWSSFQTLGINNPRYNQWRRPFALSVSLIVFIGNVSVPLAILSGLVR
jgi:succinate dehydrogenase / fumarate reductase, cytochrome b subunit